MAFSRCCAMVLALLSSSVRAASDPSFQVPPGFEVSLYAGDDLAHDIFSMTIDSHGRVVVAGKEYVKILHDADGDGLADKVSLFSPVPKSGAHGMYFDGDDLLITGDNAVSILHDKNGDGVADGPPVVWSKNVKHSEHGCNGIIKGPDGWFYNINGNDAGINAAHASLPHSPITQPSQGTLVRISPDGRGSQVLAHGFRNPYDIDFTPAGHIFTVDSDGERDHHLPWYAPNRLFDIAIGMHHGWMINGWQRSWNRPAYFPDNVDRAAQIGRGSPTGVICYRHRQFPEKFRGGIFSLCWTFGTVYFFPMQPEGSTFRATAEKFMQTTGNVGFAPVDLAVGPEGDLFVAIGGRGTRGGVFRVKYVPPANTGRNLPGINTSQIETRPNLLPEEQNESDAYRVINADQPLSSWSRARWIPLAKNAGPELFERYGSQDEYEQRIRIRAIEVLTELFGGVSNDFAKHFAITDRKDDPRVVARVAWSLSHRPEDPVARRIVVRFTDHADPIVQRAAWEALICMASLPEELEPSPAWARALGGKDRRVRAAALNLARTTGKSNFMKQTEATLGAADPRFDLANLWFEGIDHVNADWTNIYCHSCLAVFCEHKDPALRMEAIRLIQLALGDIRTEPGPNETETGYSAKALDRVNPDLRADLVRVLTAQFPTEHHDLDLEIARALAMLRAEDPALPQAIAWRWSEDSSPGDDVHYLLVMAQLTGPRTPQVTAATAHAIASLHGKMEARRLHPSRFWPMWVTEALERISKIDAGLPAALAGEAAFGRPDHAVFIPAISDPQVKRLAAGKLLAAAQASPSPQAWTPELIEALAILPDAQLLPELRARSDDPRLRDAIALILAAKNEAEDRPRILAALESSNSRVVEACAQSLAQGAKGDGRDIAVILRALSRHEQNKTTAQTLIALLTAWSGRTIQSPAGATFKPWYDWFIHAYPKQAGDLVNFGPVDAAGWQKRLAAVNWSAGDWQRGRIVYQQRACVSCHEGARRFGPELRGSGRRFSREDYFAQIINPSASIAPTYQALQITTRDGNVYVGSPVYQSPDSTILQIGIDATVRLTGDQVASTEPARRSPMPEGLLNGLSDSELADLYAYLQTLK